MTSTLIACHLTVGVVDAAQRDLLDHVVGHEDRGLAGAVQHVGVPGGVRVAVGLGVVGLPDVVREERPEAVVASSERVSLGGFFPLIFFSKLEYKAHAGAAFAPLIDPCSVKMALIRLAPVANLLY